MEYEANITELESDGANGEIVEARVNGLRRPFPSLSPDREKCSIEVRYIATDWFVSPDDIAQHLSRYDCELDHPDLISKNVYNDIATILFEDEDEASGSLEVTIFIGDEEPVVFGGIDE